VLHYDLDLRSLRNSLTPDLLDQLEVRFQINTPAKVQILNAEADGMPLTTQKGRQVIWQLHPGHQSQVEAQFWLPSPLGFGFLMIVLLMVGGALVKVLLLPPGAFVEGGDR
jgi:hypothetical protein